MKTILFRGGMVGDLLLTMLDPSCLETKPDGKQRINHHQSAMKKFFRYSDQEKINYYKDAEKKYDYIISHDTDFCLNQKNNVIQLVCSDFSKLLKFSQRFLDLHKPHVIQETADALSCNIENFVEHYANSLELWQQCFDFPIKFDVRNIGNEQFLSDVFQTFDKVDKQWAQSVYYKWLDKEQHI